MADTLALEASAERRVGSNPTLDTILKKRGKVMKSTVVVKEFQKKNP